MPRGTFRVVALVAAAALAAIANAPTVAAEPGDSVAMLQSYDKWKMVSRHQIASTIVTLHQDFPLLGSSHFLFDQVTGLSQTGAGIVQYIHRTTGAAMVLVPGGTFQMGSTDPGAKPDETVHTITVSPFLMSLKELTWEQAARGGACAFSNQKPPAAHPRAAATNMTWDEAAAWCAARSVRLPTEAEWEYAARATTTGPVWFEEKQRREILAPGPDVRAEPADRPVYRNPFGLVAMLGNAAEWTGDWYEEYDVREAVSRNPTGPAAGDNRVVRGGAVGDPVDRVRTAARAFAAPGDRNARRGFRFVVPLEPMVAEPFGKPVKFVSGELGPYKASRDDLLLWRRLSVAQVTGGMNELAREFAAIRSLKPKGDPRDWVAQGYPHYTTGPLPSYVHDQTGIEFRYVPGGTFFMGSPDYEEQRNADEPMHTVTLPSFLVSIREVSEDEWFKGGGKPRDREVRADGRMPVTRVTYDEARNWSEALGYQLPTEAQWEWAARGGAWDTFGHHFANSRRVSPGNVDAGRPFWPATTPLRGDTRLQSARNGEQAGFGLDNLLGNAAEWCFDWYGSYPVEPSYNPAGASSGQHRVVRGGSYKMGAEAARCAARFAALPKDRYDDIGFRVVVNLGSQPKPAGRSAKFEPRADPAAGTEPSPSPSKAVTPEPSPSASESGAPGKKKVDTKIELFGAVASDPAEVEGDRLLLEGKWAAAVDSYKKVPKTAETGILHVKIAAAWEELKDDTKCKNSLNRALQIDKANPVVQHEMARFYMRIGDWKGAATSIRSTLRTEPVHPASKLIAAHIFAQAERWEDAITYCEMVLNGQVAPVEEIDPWFYKLIQFDYGLALRGTGKFEQAVEQMLKVAEVFDDPLIHMEILETLVKAGRRLAAYEYADTMAKRFPSAATAFRVRQVEVYATFRTTPEAKKLREGYVSTIRVDTEREFTIQRPPFPFFQADSFLFSWGDTVRATRSVFDYDSSYSFAVPGRKNETIAGSDSQSIVELTAMNITGNDKKAKMVGGVSKVKWATDAHYIEVDGTASAEPYYILLMTTRHNLRTVLISVRIGQGIHDKAFVKLLIPILQDSLGSITWADKK